MVTNRFISCIIPCLFDEHFNFAATEKVAELDYSFNFVLSLVLKHTALNQLSKAQIDSYMSAALLGMILKF